MSGVAAKGTIIETGPDSYRLAHTRKPARVPERAHVMSH